MDGFIIIVILLLAVFLGACCIDYAKNEKVKSAKFHGILINGKHYKVFSVYRSSSYTDGGVYVKHHNVKYFDEMMLLSQDKNKIFISQSHLLYCLKVHKHTYSKKIDDKWTKKWSEWEIDWNVDDEILHQNDIYLAF